MGTKELLSEWETFTAHRESERHRLQNPEGSDELRAELQQAKQALSQAKANVQLIEAKLMMLQTEPYSKTMFDMEWTAKKKDLREKLEKALAEEMDMKSIPDIMKEYAITNTTLLYRVRDRVKYERAQAARKMAELDWKWSDFTGTHRYALASEDGEGWTHVRMAGTKDTELEGEYAVFSALTGEFITGNREVFESDSPAGRTKRWQQLVTVLDGRYTGPWKESENPYYGGN